MTPRSDTVAYDAALHLDELRQARRIAVLMAPRLGDSALMMAMAANLARNGREVVVFGDFIYGMREAFAGMDVRPSLAEGQAKAVLADFDCAVQMHVGWPYPLHDYAKHYFYYDAHVVITGKGFVKLEQIRDFCHDAIGLPDCTQDNGLRPPAHWVFRKYPRRVAIHPSSTSEQRCWAQAHFVDLGKRLQRQGYEPYYILAAHEREQWRCLEEQGLPIQQSPSLLDVAHFIHECGWFIGNESGIGHLASNVGIPTLTLTGRPTRTRAWRPAWAPSRIVYPAYIPGGRWRDRLWRKWLLPSHVMRAFKRLVQECNNTAQSSGQSSTDGGFRQA
ncbi:hypothetical protein BTL50_11450 [Bordetella holmesii]|uniref:glycosyltransferase family 9 protein n=1 Tax=Bordetella holmesii TaxID=35814 RepID=UPI0002BA00E7|nr:glycosyltransferase family 9 protein [Bordetella holmesii]AMD47486.1 hypothetical protein F783_000485 [Bordetella holmesii F627]AUL20017.1 hypothetical protein BTL46_11390 [Bordetella holmesii]AUL23354.1 hypothetical protein BTL48_11460 [Bordetella holmesii]AUL26666.1 hypothetical protein BTL49_11465 [Bordetella holmesii]AUL30012.1 hypothetical protein BTL50_11450 [Bordetella holmesii]